jgi:hypothetical protein
MDMYCWILSLAALFVILLGLSYFFCYSLWKVFWWFILGAYLNENTDPKVESGVGHVISLMAIIGAGTVTLGVALKDTELKKLQYVYFYGIASLILLFAMTIILRASNKTGCVAAKLICKGQGNTIHHIYDNTTINFTRWMAVFCLILVISCVLLASCNKFPGQEITPINLLVDDVVGIDPNDPYQAIANIPINKLVYGDPSGLPPDLNIEVIFDKGLLDQWKIVTVELTDKKTGMALKNKLHDDDTKLPVDFIYLRELDRSGNYILRYAFYSKNKDHTKQELKTQILENNNITVIVNNKQQKSPH